MVPTSLLYNCNIWGFYVPYVMHPSLLTTSDYILTIVPEMLLNSVNLIAMIDDASPYAQQSLPSA